MKRYGSLFAFFFLFNLLVFGNSSEQDEIDFLLFLPNSSDRFVDEERAMAQLDNVAKYLRNRELDSGQILVYGYAAAVVNDIESVAFSRDRALFVINELQKRGVPNKFFADPVGFGEVDLWGDNASEKDRSSNRRVRILLDGRDLTPAVVKTDDSEIKISSADHNEETVEREEAVEHTFPWWILIPLLLLLLAAILLFARKKRKQPVKEAAPVTAAPVFVESLINLEEEIRFRAYELYLLRNGQSEDADVDWYMAVSDVNARYVADGYRVYNDGSWWAHKMTKT